MPLYSIVTGDFQDPVLGTMRFKVESLQLKVKPGNRAEREEGTQLRSAKGTSVSRRIAKGRKTHGWSCRSRFIGAAGAMRSERSPTTNSKWKPGAPGYMHMNPVKRGLVADPKLWPWSSCRFYQYGEK